MNAARFRSSFSRQSPAALVPVRCNVGRNIRPVQPDGEAAAADGAAAIPAARVSGGNGREAIKRRAYPWLA
jgi:hypothetical protein